MMIRHKSMEIARRLGAVAGCACRRWRSRAVQSGPAFTPWLLPCFVCWLLLPGSGPERGVSPAQSHRSLGQRAPVRQAQQHKQGSQANKYARIGIARKQARYGLCVRIRMLVYVMWPMVATSRYCRHESRQGCSCSYSALRLHWMIEKGLVPCLSCCFDSSVAIVNRVARRTQVAGPEHFT